MSERLAIIGPDGQLRLVSPDITGEDVQGCTLRDDVPADYPALIEWDAVALDWVAIPPPPAPPAPALHQLVDMLVSAGTITAAQGDTIKAA